MILAVAGLIAPSLSGIDRERLGRLERAARRLLRLIGGDLADAGVNGGTHRPIDVELLLIDVCELLRDRAEQAGVTLAVHCGGGTLRGDPAALCEVLLNLIGNAVEATPAGQSVSIETEVTPEGDQTWRIRDPGTGMSPEILAQVGIPHRTFRCGGTGLGVALAQSVIDEHGGWMRFESRRGIGTTVTVWLPQRMRPRRPRKAHPPEDRARSA